MNLPLIRELTARLQQGGCNASSMATAAESRPH